MKASILGPEESWKIIEGDSREVIKKIPDESIDFICTDPPYNLGQYSTGNIKMEGRADFNNDLAEWDQLTLDPGEWKDEFLRVLSPTGNIFVFTSYNLIGKWHEVFDPLFDTFQFMVWHKTNPAPKLRKAGFLNSCELIVCMWNKGHTWNFGNQRDMHNFIETPICMGLERLKNPKHPTQKPLRVMRRLIELATNPGDVVLDPFAGVASTGVAALELGRKFIGIEADPIFVKAGRERIVSTPKKLNLEIPNEAPKVIQHDLLFGEPKSPPKPKPMPKSPSNRNSKLRQMKNYRRRPTPTAPLARKRVPGSMTKTSF